jgi:hypothetical protein
VADRDRATEAEIRRHAVLRARIEQAIATLDGLLAQGEGGSG